MPNVDPNEIHHFASLANQFWNTNGDFKTLHQVNPLRMQFIRKHVQISQQKGVDVGCGGGILTEALAKAGAKMTGIDLAEPSLDVAKLHAQSQLLNIDYDAISAEAFAEENKNKFDFVTCMEMLEHVPDPAAIVQACSDLLHPEGVAIFSTLNRNAKSFLGAIVGAEHILKMIPKGTHHYEKFITPAELTEMARAAGLHPIASSGIAYHPLRKQFSLSKSLDINYMLAFSKI